MKSIQKLVVGSVRVRLEVRFERLPIIGRRPGTIDVRSSWRSRWLGPWHVLSLALAIRRVDGRPKGGTPFDGLYAPSTATLASAGAA